MKCTGRVEQGLPGKGQFRGNETPDYDPALIQPLEDWRGRSLRGSSIRPAAEHMQPSDKDRGLSQTMSPESMDEASLCLRGPYRVSCRTNRQKVQLLLVSGQQKPRQQTR